MKQNIFFVFFFATALVLSAQTVFHIIDDGVTTPLATAFNNGFKAVSRDNMPEFGDSIFVVYSRTPDSVYYAMSTDYGTTWEKHSVLASPWGTARFPSLDIHPNGPFIVYESDSSGKGEIFLENPFDRSMPYMISDGRNDSRKPAIVVCSNDTAHIVWEEEVGGNWNIFYYCTPTVSGDAVPENISGLEGHDRHATISVSPHGIEVLWESYDEPSDSPYSIRRRTKTHAGWGPIETLAVGWTPLGHPSLGHSRGDWLSAVWESTDTIVFWGGNGAVNTSGVSTYPVVSTIGHTYSYYYFENELAGRRDVFAHLFYNGCDSTRWSYYLRDMEDTQARYPSTSGCWAVFTQGESAPYSVMFVYENYPTGIGEIAPTKPQAIALSVFPNPFNSAVSIVAPAGAEVEIFDIAGRRVAGLPVDGSESAKPLSTNASGVCRWQPDEAVGSGVYLVRARVDTRSLSGGPRAESRGVEAAGATAVKRVVYLK